MVIALVLYFLAKNTQVPKKINKKTQVPKNE